MVYCDKLIQIKFMSEKKSLDEVADEVEYPSGKKKYKGMKKGFSRSRYKK